MTKSHQEIHADAARKVLDAYRSDNPDEDLATRIADLVTDIGHLCMTENLDFLGLLRSGIRHWAVERIDPNSTLPGPSVEITISVEGLPPPPEPKKRAEKPKKVRVPR